MFGNPSTDYSGQPMGPCHCAACQDRFHARYGRPLPTTTNDPDYAAFMADSAREVAKVIGDLLLFKYDEGSRRIELGYVLGRVHWGKGLMREAITAACACAFDELGIRRIEAEVNPENLASCALLLKVGFALEGRLRKRWEAKGNAYDTNIYGWLA